MGEGFIISQHFATPQPPCGKGTEKWDLSGTQPGIWIFRHPEGETHRSLLPSAARKPFTGVPGTYKRFPNHIAFQFFLGTLSISPSAVAQRDYFCHLSSILPNQPRVCWACFLPYPRESAAGDSRGAVTWQGGAGFFFRSSKHTQRCECSMAGSLKSVSAASAGRKLYKNSHTLSAARA